MEVTPTLPAVTFLRHRAALRPSTASTAYRVESKSLWVQHTLISGRLAHLPCAPSLPSSPGALPLLPPRSIGSGAKLPKFKSQLCHFPARRTGAHYLTLPCLLASCDDGYNHNSSSTYDSPPGVSRGSVRECLPHRYPSGVAWAPFDGMLFSILTFRTSLSPSVLTTRVTARYTPPPLLSYRFFADFDPLD